MNDRIALIDAETLEFIFYSLCDKYGVIGGQIRFNRLANSFTDEALARVNREANPWMSP